MDCPKCGCDFTSQFRPVVDDTLIGTFGADSDHRLVLIVRHAWSCWGCGWTWRIAKQSWTWSGMDIRKHKERDDDI